MCRGMKASGIHSHDGGEYRGPSLRFSVNQPIREGHFLVGLPNDLLVVGYPPGDLLAQRLRFCPGWLIVNVLYDSRLQA